MNEYMKAQITNMTIMVKTFEHSCKMAATKNDGLIDKNEERQLKKISAATQRFERNKITRGRPLIGGLFHL